MKQNRYFRAKNITEIKLLNITVKRIMEETEERISGREDKQ